MSTAIVDVKGLTVEFPGRPPVRAVGGVDLLLKPGEVLALLGESGSGKSVTLRALMRLLPKRADVGGSIRVDGRDVRAMGAAELSAYRGPTIAMVFQEPGLALDPVYRVGDQIAEAVVRHAGVSWGEGRARALELFERVRIPSAARRLDNFPHEMSGGMRQRAMIALALSCRPKVLLADEPTTALDATVQIQILLLLRELQRELGLAVIFVTHDIGVATEIADRIAVMYAGRIVETGSCRAGPPRLPRRPGFRARHPPARDPRRAARPRAAAARLRLRAALREGARRMPDRVPGRDRGRRRARGAVRAVARQQSPDLTCSNEWHH